MRRLVMIFGASGSGKTAVAELLAERPPWTGNTHFFDSIGVPSPDEMASFGGAESWQRWATEQWIDRLARAEFPIQLLEAQTRPSYFQPVLARHPQVRAKTILLDCRWDVRTYRLVELRQRAELVNPEMQNWAAYLRGQADALGLPVIDTSDLTLDEVTEKIEEIVGPAESI